MEARMAQYLATAPLSRGVILGKARDGEAGLVPSGSEYVVRADPSHTNSVKEGQEGKVPVGAHGAQRGHRGHSRPGWAAEGAMLSTDKAPIRGHLEELEGDPVFKRLLDLLASHAIGGNELADLLNGDVHL